MPALHVQALDTSDHAAAEVARRIVRAGAAVGDVWPGFWGPDAEFVIRPFAGGALYVSPRSPPRVTGRSLAGPSDDPLPRHAVVLGDTVRAGMLDLDYDVGGRRVAAFGMLNAGGMDLSQIFAIVIYHESFHVYQARAFVDLWADREAESGLDGRVLAAPAVRASLAVERRLLRSALREADSGARVARVRDYLAVRADRAARLPPNVAEHEAGLERREGSAQLVGFRAAAIAAGGQVEDVRAIVVQSLLDPELDDVTRDRLRRHAYATGSAIGMLLDDLGQPWQERLARGATFEGLLAEAVAFDVATAETRAVRAKVDSGYDEMLLRFTAQPIESDPLAKFENHAGARVVLVGLSSDESSYRGQASDAVAGTRVYLPGTTLTLQGRGFFVESRGLNVMDDQRGRRPAWVVLVDGDVRVNGLSPVAGSSAHNAVVIAADGLDVRIEIPATAEWDGRTLTVTVTSGRP